MGHENPANGNGAVRSGGIYAHTAHSVQLQGSAAVRHNSAGDGGGLYLAGNTPLTMTGGLIVSNTTPSWGGGLAMVSGSAILTVVVISGNTAAEGGGVALNQGDILFQAVNTQITYNTASQDGGGMHADGDADVYMIGGVWLAGNTALANGGGLYQSGGTLLVIGEASQRPHIQDNEALNGHGGGLYLDDISSGLGVVGSLLRDATLLGNQADSDGGGLYAVNGS